MELFDNFILDGIVGSLRDRMWAVNIKDACRFVPKGVPHILAGGAAHIAKVLTLLEGSPEDGKQDAKEKS